jgi:phospholipid/cholesterol/gamma-HCH transport system permease protein
MNSTRDALELSDVFGGLAKTVVFGFLIALIACERGMETRGGAEGVGRSTTSAVVTILFHLILVDALFTVLYKMIGI